MSRPAIIIGLVLAIGLHWALLRPTSDTSSSNAPAVAARIAMRELPEPAPTETEPAPASQDAPAPPPVATPTPTVPAPPAPRPPDPVEQASTAAPLARTATPQRNTLEQRGDFSGDRTGTARPSLRIDWGTAQQARSIVEAADMRLVLLGATGGITGEVASADGGWHRLEEAPSDLSGYSNRVRIVDSTPAFARASSLRTGGERLAVLLPVALEHSLRTQQIRVAAEAGVESSRIRAFYGRFRIDAGRVDFAISGFERRSS
ncbi:MAG: hypothetical protein MK116_10880 [Phycisphaerales bacterium]|nr:hypothetical protein [Phycisphaerales bacterium]